MFGVQDILAVVFVAGAFWYVIRFIRRSMSGKGGCHCEQGSSCGGGSEPRVARRNDRRVQLVTLSHAAKNEVDHAEPSDSSPSQTRTTSSRAPGSE